MESAAILMRSNADFRPTLVRIIPATQESGARTPCRTPDRRMSASAFAAPTMLSLIDGYRPELHAPDLSSSLDARRSEFR
jgi:hypothetical protein